MDSGRAQTVFLKFRMKFISVVAFNTRLKHAFAAYSPFTQPHGDHGSMSMGAEPTAAPPRVTALSDLAVLPAGLGISEGLELLTRLLTTTPPQDCGSRAGLEEAGSHSRVAVLWPVNPQDCRGTRPSVFASWTLRW